MQFFAARYRSQPSGDKRLMSFSSASRSPPVFFTSLKYGFRYVLRGSPPRRQNSATLCGEYSCAWRSMQQSAICCANSSSSVFPLNKRSINTCTSFSIQKVSFCRKNQAVTRTERVSASVISITTSKCSVGKTSSIRSGHSIQISVRSCANISSSRSGPTSSISSIR